MYPLRSTTHQSFLAGAFFGSLASLRPVMQAHFAEILNLLLLASFAGSADHPTISHRSLFLPAQHGRISCDARTKPPVEPSFQDCHDFLWDLSIKSHEEPQGAFRWYGRNLGPCVDCVKLPTIIHNRKQKCAALIDVDDKDSLEFSVFDLKELWRALSDMVGVCWLREKHNGRGYPGSQTAWAALVRGIGTRSGVLTQGSMAHGNKTFGIIDLSEMDIKNLSASHLDY